MPPETLERLIPIAASVETFPPANTPEITVAQAGFEILAVRTANGSLEEDCGKPGAHGEPGIGDESCIDARVPVLGVASMPVEITACCCCCSAHAHRFGDAVEGGTWEGCPSDSC